MRRQNLAGVMLVEFFIQDRMSSSVGAPAARYSSYSSPFRSASGPGGTSGRSIARGRRTGPPLPSPLIPIDTIPPANRGPDTHVTGNPSQLSTALEFACTLKAVGRHANPPSSFRSQPDDHQAQPDPHRAAPPRRRRAPSRHGRRCSRHRHLASRGALSLKQPNVQESLPAGQRVGIPARSGLLGPVSAFRVGDDAGRAVLVGGLDCQPPGPALVGRRGGHVPRPLAGSQRGLLSLPVTGLRESMSGRSRSARCTRTSGNWHPAAMHPPSAFRGGGFPLMHITQNPQVWSG